MHSRLRKEYDFVHGDDRTDCLCGETMETMMRMLVMMQGDMQMREDESA